MDRNRPRLLVRSATWLVAGAFGALALYQPVTRHLAERRAAARLNALEAKLGSKTDAEAPIDPAIWLRVQRLGPLLASWETIGGCGAGSTGGAGVVKWIGRSTTGGLFQSITQANYIHFNNGYNFVVTEQ